MNASEVLCAQTDPELWSPKRPNANMDGSVRVAKALCHSCVALDDCMDMFMPDAHTIQAGMTPKEQLVYAKARDSV